MFMGKAMWTFTTPNTIYISDKFDDWDAIDEVAHELVHRRQWQRDGTFKYMIIKAIGRFTGFIGRLFGFDWDFYEYEAYAMEDLIDMTKRDLGNGK